PPPADVAVPFVQVDVTEKVPAYFSRLLTGTGEVPVHATAACGLTSTPGPVPIIVLHPTDSATIDMRGAPSLIQVVGGPQQSIQVNSNNPSAVTTGSLSTVDLTLGGPDNTGSSFGTFGGQASQPGSVTLGSTGKWLYPHLPISDPYRNVQYPAVPTTMGVSVSRNFTQDGCPDTTGCTEYQPGYYPSGIKVQDATAIFVPGLYYIGGQGANHGLDLGPNSIVRIATGPGLVRDDGNLGVTFYFSGNGSTSVNIDANSGKPHGSLQVCTSSPTNCVVQYHKDGSSEFGVASLALKCPAGENPPDEVPATIPGNVLLAPCTGAYGDPARDNRGFLYFQDRAVAVDGSRGGGVPSWQGGGSTLAAGFMYFHQCHADHTGTEPCDAPTAGFGDVFHMGGTPGSGSYAVGSLVTDKIFENGNPGLLMILDPDNTFPQYKIVFFH
ncbi:MAG TPA: hypothetical protein VKB58_12190, partial [Terriglobales bacterium]|nr:hypothetical protein [Terriglobales bacterium]